MASLSPGRLGQREVGLERVGQVLPAVGQLVERGERRERRAIGPEVVDDRAVGEDGGSATSASLSASVVAMRTMSVRRASRSSVWRSRARSTSTSSRQLCVRS